MADTPNSEQWDSKAQQLIDTLNVFWHWFSNDPAHAEKLKTVGFDQKQADMNVRLERIDGELTLNRWMLGVILAGVLSIVLKTFF